MTTDKVTATVSTKGRYHNTFPLVLTSLANQTLKPSRLIIYDDNDALEDLRENEIYKNLFALLNRVGIQWEVTVGGRKGQIHNHQRALTDVKSEWIWRLDDDNVMETDTLERLFSHTLGEANKDVGAVGPLILDPKNQIGHSMASNKMEDIFFGLNIQWVDDGSNKVVEVDHLQGSTFIFRTEAAKHGYDLRLSKVGHREETIFTHEIKRAGWRLLVDTSIKTWHMRYGAGGIRSQNNVKLFENDEKIFHDYLRKWKIESTKLKVIPLDSGIGDHYAFRSILPSIKAKFKDHRIVIGACYPEVFKDETGIEVINLAEAASFTDIKEHNIYGWMDRRNWKKSLSEAYRAKYTQ